MAVIIISTSEKECTLKIMLGSGSILVEKEEKPSLFSHLLQSVVDPWDCFWDTLQAVFVKLKSYKSDKKFV